MYPRTPLLQTTRRYEAALRLSPPVRNTIGWPAAFPESGGIGDVWDDITSLFKGASGAVIGPIEKQAADLKRAIKIIMVLSGIAAATGTLTLLRGR